MYAEYTEKRLEKTQTANRREGEGEKEKERQWGILARCLSLSL
jgi:hypothetical protein